MADRPKILAVKLSSLGDLFHALPAVQAVKAGLDAEIHWVTQPEYMALVQHFDPVDAVIAFPRKAWMSQGKDFIRQLRTTTYDAVLDFQGLLKSALVCRLAQAPLRIGPATLREVPRNWYSRTAKAGSRGAHAVDQGLALAESLGVAVDKVEFPVTFPIIEHEPSLPLLGVAPCSRWPAKNWPENQLIEALQAIQEKHTCQVVLLGSPADRDVCQRIADALAGPALNTAGQSSLVELGSWIQALDGLITNDSGPMHMAVALDVPMVALFGPTDPQRTGPYGRMQDVLRPPAESLEAVSHRAYKHLDDSLIGEIPVSQVVDATVGILEGSK